MADIYTKDAYACVCAKISACNISEIQRKLIHNSSVGVTKFCLMGTDAFVTDCSVCISLAFLNKIQH